MIDILIRDQRFAQGNISIRERERERERVTDEPIFCEISPPRFVPTRWMEGRKRKTLEERTIAFFRNLRAILKDENCFNYLAAFNSIFQV